MLKASYFFKGHMEQENILKNKYITKKGAMKY